MLFAPLHDAVYIYSANHRVDADIERVKEAMRNAVAATIGDGVPIEVGEERYTPESPYRE